MAAMYGRIEWYGERTCGCCWLGKSKRQQRQREHRQWQKDFTDEATYQEPTYPPGYDHYPEGGHAWPENLDGVERVSFIPARGN